MDRRGLRAREVAALAGGGVLLLSRRTHSRATLGLVDWRLLVAAALLSNGVSNVPADPGPSFAAHERAH